MNLTGKRLLVLGGGNSTYGVVECAKKMGLYIICVGQEQGGIAKDLADEAYCISTTDHEALVALIKEKNIDGVFTGASEFNIQNVIKVAHMAGLPCYCNEDQWALMQDKRNYKDTCKKYGIPVVPEYPQDTDPADIVYPVIVKPTDGCSSKGVMLVKKAEELPQAIAYAKEYSVCKEVIIERFMDCKAIAAFYTVQDGVPSLSHIVDIFQYNNRDGIPTITSVSLYPSNLLEAYLQKMDKKICDMIKGIGLKNGVVSFQIFTENEEFYAFECCLRISGNYDFPIIERINGINYLEMMIEYAVTGSMGEKIVAQWSDPSFHGMYAANLVLMLREGEIGSISGVEKVMEHKNIVAMNAPSFAVGSVIRPEYIGTLLQTFTRFHLVGEDFEDLKAAINYIFDTVQILDTNGNNMLYSQFDHAALDAWKMQGK